jgi:hypothetical protein
MAVPLESLSVFAEAKIPILVSGRYFRPVNLARTASTSISGAGAGSFPGRGDVCDGSLAPYRIRVAGMKTGSSSSLGGVIPDEGLTAAETAAAGRWLVANRGGPLGTGG